MKPFSKTRGVNASKTKIAKTQPPEPHNRPAGGMSSCEFNVKKRRLLNQNLNDLDPHVPRTWYTQITGLTKILEWAPVKRMFH